MMFASRSLRWLLPVAILLLALISSSACRRSPEARKAYYLGRGDRDFANERYPEAIIEYLNVLRIDPTNARALRNTGLAHFELGELGQSYQFLLRSQQLDPENAEARLKLASIYLAARKLDEAKTKRPSSSTNSPATSRPCSCSPERGVAGRNRSGIKRLELARARFEKPQIPPRIGHSLRSRGIPTKPSRNSRRP